MTTPKPPGVYITEQSSGVRMIVGVGTSTPAFLGYTKVPDGGTGGTATPPFTAEERTHPQLIRGWQEFTDRYSIEALRQRLAALRKKQEAGQDPTPVERKEIRVLERCFPLAEAVYGFFANGGQSCYVVGFTDPTTAVSAAQLGGSTETRTGLGGLETVPEVTMVAVPSLWDMTAAASDAPAPPPLDPAQGKPLMDAAVAHCVAMRNRLAILDAPPGQPVEPLKAFVDGLTSPDTEDAAFTTLYYPWLEVPGVDGIPRTVPPSGHIAGIWARTDAERGVFKAPANQNIRGALAIPTLLTDDQHGELNNKGVNCLRVFPDRGLLVWGARTRSTSRDWKYLNVRRLVSFLADSIRQSSTWAVFEPNDDRLWATLRHSTTSFLTDQWRQGALLGRTPDEAFYVICDTTNNTPTTIDDGKVICDIGIAPVRPAEFVHFTLTQTAGETGKGS
ncbi:phage tail sheath subtilisin-like domain-containing protein [Streptomyces sp. NBC_00536]|uniref:phage tail sheath family protein n=1 Tax=Streptomyces sp. NBC_00536 TaxID=2975769 RepID=UPI002E816151|nr:phage tail sheath C-terminal domain-containing protein [Streptomyces sp. NBC_00536]WUC82458.1 phage tail sheath subtilisin-like domain-containing protein [Streptomyces sp. NBC_00536]